MKKIDIYYFYFQTIFISILPIALITGPAIPDIIVSSTSLIFVLKIFLFKQFSLIKNRLFLLLLIFYIYIVLNSIFSENIFLSLESSLFYIRFIFFAFLINDLLKYSDKLIFYLLISFLFAFTVLIFDSYFQYFFGSNILGYEYDGQRLSSLFNDEKILGSYLSRLTPFFLGLVLYLYPNSKKIIIVSLIYLLFLDILVILSGERTSIFYIFFSTLLILILISKWKIYRFVAFAFSIFISILIILFNQSVRDRVVSKTIDQTNILGDKINYFSVQHQVIYSTSIKIFLDYPIFGIGPKNFRNICKKEKYKTFTKEDQSVDGCQTHPHNTYVQLLTETGFVGFIFVFSLFFLILKKLFLQFYNLYFLKKIYLKNYQICFYITILISLWPFVPTGSFFNNWLSIIYFLPVGFILSGTKSK